MQNIPMKKNTSMVKWIVTLSSVLCIHVQGRDTAHPMRTNPKSEIVSADAGVEPEFKPTESDLEVDTKSVGGLTSVFAAAIEDIKSARGDVAIHVKNLTTGEDVFAHQPNSRKIPASNAKLWTALTALEVLGANFQYKTEFWIRGTVENGHLKGALLIKGHGDPTITNERLEQIAWDLSHMGIHRIDQIIYDVDYFDEVSEAAGWAEEGSPDRAYAAGVSALSLNYNAIGVHIQPRFDGAAADVYLVPDSEYGVLMGRVRSGRRMRRLRVHTQRDEEDTIVMISGTAGTRDGGRRIHRRVYTPPKYFVEVLRKRLRAHGVRVGQRVRRSQVKPTDRLLYTSLSKPLSEILVTLNHFSNNLIAETLIKTVSAVEVGVPGTFEGGMRTVRRILQKDVGLDKATFDIGNGSGLNRVNWITPHALTDLIAYVYERRLMQPEWEASLAVAAEKGTLRHRMKMGEAAGRVRAKTGTLTGVSVLSGLLKNHKNEILAFSLMMDRYQSKKSVRDIWAIQDRLVETLVSSRQ